MKYLTFITALLLFTSCYFDSEEKLTENIPCKSGELSYRDDVVPVLAANCYACHSIAEAPTSGDGIVLEGYGNLLDYLETQAQTFIGSIEHNGDGKPMPDDGAKMDRCSIQALTDWIEQGKNDN